MSSTIDRRTMLAALAAVPLLIRSSLAQDTEFYPGEPGALLAPRRALVIGVGKYTSPVRTLYPGPVIDASSVYGLLQSLGFGAPPPLLDADADKRGILSALSALSQRIKEAPGLGVIYFAGHGFSVDGRAYVVPADGAPLEGSHIDDWAIPVERLTAAFRDGGARAAVLILDACRNNPFGATEMPGVSTGTVQPHVTGVYIAASTIDGATASNGTGSNSPFTGAFVRLARSPGQNVDSIFNNVRTTLAVSGTQVNESTSTAVGIFSLLTTRKEYLGEQNSFKEAKSHNNPMYWQFFLNLFPVGYFYQQAIQALQASMDQGPQITDELIKAFDRGRSSAFNADLDIIQRTPELSGFHYSSASQKNNSMSNIAAPAEIRKGSQLAELFGMLPEHSPPLIAYGLTDTKARLVGKNFDAVVDQDQLTPLLQSPQAAAVDFDSLDGAAHVDERTLTLAIARITNGDQRVISVQASLGQTQASGEPTATFSAIIQVAEALYKAGVARENISFAPLIRATETSKILLSPSQ